MKRQRGKNYRKIGTICGKKQKALSWVLCVALLSGSVCVPEYTGISVRAAESVEMSEKMTEVAVADVSNQENVSGQDVAWQENCPSWDATDVSGGDGSSEDEVLKLVSLNSEEDNIAGGSYENITWEIDAEGKLTVEGTGDFSAQISWERAPWYSQRENIKSAVICVTGLKDASYIFYGCWNLTSVDLRGLDTSSVTNMGSMFYGCEGLGSVNLSGLDTSHVTDMSEMFYDCESLESLDLSGLDTSSVTNMSSMFEKCWNLPSVDLSGLDTSHVTDMSEMFYDCESLESLDLSGLDTSSVTNMSSMFYGCSGLTSLDLSGFNTSSVTNMSSMFYGCSGLTSLDLSGFNTSSVTNMSSMFYGCSGLTSLDLSGFNTSSATNMRAMFYGCSGLTSLDLSGLDTSSATNMRAMFYGCSGLTSLDLSGLDTSSVTNMSSMFERCWNLPSVDLSGFNTSSVTNMSSMFYGCNSLTSLDLSGFDTIQVMDMEAMFYDCTGITQIKTFPNLQQEVILPVIMHDGNGNRYVDFPMGLADSVMLYTENCENITWEIDAEGRLTVEGTGEFSALHGYGRAPWHSQRKNITSAVVHATGLKDASYMFSGCENLTSVDLSGLDTSSVIDMDGMFYGCSGLISLDLGGLDTSHVTDMSDMFYGCSGLISLDLGGLDTSSVTNMNYMFSGCRCLTSLDLSSFDTSSVKDMYYMFSDCIGIAQIKTFPNLQLKVELPVIMHDGNGNTYVDFPIGLTESVMLYIENCENITWEIDAEGKLIVEGTGEISALRSSERAPWYRQKNRIKSAVVRVTGMKDASYMFSDCENLRSVDLSGLDTSSVTDMSDMFYGCSGLINLDLSGLDTSSVTDMSDMFYGCSGLINLDLSGLDTSHVTDISDMFSGCSSLTSLDVSGFDTSNVMYIGNMFSGCVCLTSLDLSGFDTSCVTSMAGMFEDCSSLKCLDVSSFDTSSVTNMEVMFKNCSSLTSLDVSGFDTRNVIRMGREHSAIGYRGMFFGCDSLLSLDLSGFDMSRVTDAGYMLACSSLTRIYTPYNTSLNISIGRGWYDAAGNTYKTLPEGLDYSIVLTKNAIPAPDAMQAKLTVRLAKTSYEQGSNIRPEDLTVKYRGTDGRTITLSYQGDNADVQGYTMSTVDMNTPGTKTLTISYNDGTDTLIESVTFIVFENPVDPDDPNNPTDPTDPTFPDDGTFRISAVPVQTYTGSAIKPVVTVYYGSRRLTEKTDYTVTYKNNTKANDATVEQTAPTITVTGKGNYSGKQTITFVIKPKNIAEEDVAAAELIAAQSNKIQKPVPTLTWQGKKLKNKMDFTVSYPDESKSGAYQMAGTYTVAVTGIGNYTGTKNLTYTITNKTLLTNAKVTVKAKDYTGSAVTLNAEDITVKVGKDTLTYGTDYTLSYRNNTQAGKATVIVTGTGDSYAGSKEATFLIKGESLAKAQISGVVDKTYTGTAQTQNIQVQLNGKTLQEGTDYTVSYAKELNAGTASVIVTGKGGYTGTVKNSFKITAYDLQADEAGKLQGVPQNLTTTYVKGGATPTLALTFNGKSLVAKKDYTVTYKNNKKPGAAADTKAPVMIVKGKGNFRGILSIPFAITVSNLEMDGNVTITAADTAYVNKTGKYAVKPVLTDANGKKLTAGTDYEKTLTYALINSDGTETVLTTADIVPEGGIVKVTATGKGSYTGTLSATYHITKFSFSKAKITVNPQIYTGVPVTLSEQDVTVKIDGAALIYGKDYTIVPGSYQNNTKKGTATVTIKGMGDYGGTKTVKFKITAKPFAALLKF